MNKKYKALVVDDDEDICNAVSALLKAKNHDCNCANDLNTAKDLFARNKYDYVILDMELPIRMGGPLMIDTGMLFLSLIREKYTKEKMPVIVLTSKMNTPENIGSISDHCCREDANRVIQKAMLYDVGRYSLDNAINEVVEKREYSSNRQTNGEWLFRIPNEKSTKMTWKTVAMNGHERSYPIGTGTIRGRLLDCIYRMLDKGDVICISDLIAASGQWNHEKLFSDEKDKTVWLSRGPMKSHAAFYKRELGIKITFLKNGIRVEQPED